MANPPTAAEMVNEAQISHLRAMQSGLKAERRSLSRAQTRIAEIDAHLVEIGKQLDALGYKPAEED
jgi:hypothetical protein